MLHKKVSKNEQIDLQKPKHNLFRKQNDDLFNFFLVFALVKSDSFKNILFLITILGIRTANLDEQNPELEPEPNLN